MTGRAHKSARTDKGPHVHIERGAKDRILPKQFIRVLTRRYFPVLSLTYVSSVIGIAYKKGHMEHYLLEMRNMPGSLRTIDMRYLSYDLSLFYI